MTNTNETTMAMPMTAESTYVNAEPNSPELVGLDCVLDWVVVDWENSLGEKVEDEVIEEELSDEEPDSLDEVLEVWTVESKVDLDPIF